jgi:predicted small secreted protein
MPIIRRGALFVMLGVSVLVMAACENTIRGAGRDVSETANAVEDAASDVVQ